MSSYAEALLVFYAGEVAGEAFYSVSVGAGRNDVERLKWATLLQLETEAWVEHEKAQGEFARRELTDDGAASSLELLRCSREQR